MDDFLRKYNETDFTIMICIISMILKQLQLNNQNEFKYIFEKKLQ